MRVTLVSRVITADGDDGLPSVTYEGVERITGTSGFTPQIRLHRRGKRPVYRACSGIEVLRVAPERGDEDVETTVIEPDQVGCDPPAELPICATQEVSECR